MVRELLVRSRWQAAPAACLPLENSPWFSLRFARNSRSMLETAEIPAANTQARLPE